jgi:hypothetical protein
MEPRGSVAVERGRRVAAFWSAVAPRLFADLLESGLLPAADDAGTRGARDEWETFALHACVRGLVAASGFTLGTEKALDAFHAAVLEHTLERAGTLDAVDAFRDRMTARYAEYGAIEREGGAAGAATVTARLGAAAGLHLLGAPASAELAEFLGALHETLAEGAVAVVRAEPAP